MCKTTICIVYSANMEAYRNTYSIYEEVFTESDNTHESEQVRLQLSRRIWSCFEFVSFCTLNHIISVSILSS